jgi:hypothetical protein
MDRRIVSILFIIGILWAIVAVLNLLPTTPPSDADIQPAIHVDPNVTLTFETPEVRTLSNG